MKINYDSNADALYIHFSDAAFAKTRRIDNTTLLDLDSNNNVIGVELLNASKKMIIPSTDSVTISKI